MSSLADPSSREAAHPQHFATTKKSIVLAAGQAVSRESRGALEALYQAYWFPVETHVRRSASAAADDI